MTSLSFSCQIISQSSSDTKAAANVLTADNISYAYFYGLTEQDASDSPIMVDQSSDVATTKTDAWEEALSGAVVNHGDEGVNALYLDGHVKWIPKTSIVASEFTTGDTVIRNPGNDCN